MVLVDTLLAVHNYHITQTKRHTLGTDQTVCHWSPYDQQGQTTPEAVGSSTHMIPNVSMMSYTGSHDLHYHSP